MSVLGAVLIEGPKACGKTATASQSASTVVRLDDDAMRALVSLDPDALFTGRPPILFDEWQVEPSIWNRVRRQVDDRNEAGQFILTGSATPRDDVSRHSGAGRIATLRMRPMTLFESGHSSGAVSFTELVGGAIPRGDAHPLSYDDLLTRIVIGGWPQLVHAEEREARIWLDAYLDQLVEVDVPALGGRRDPAKLRRLLASLGRNVGQPVKHAELERDVGGDQGQIATETLSAYLDALARLMLRDDTEAWRPHMRSRTRLRSAAVRYFVDPSIGPAALGVGSPALKADPRAAGYHFEALAMRDLKVFAQAVGGTVTTWRDANGNEVDAIVTMRDGTWAAFEIKLNPRDVDAASSSLSRFVSAVDVERHGPPVALTVLTGSGAVGRRPDGVNVVPIGALGP
jgi:predicted AAA+ superfamily ATPase